MAEWITPDWPAPPQVKAAATLRTGGVSAAPFESLNLGSHVGDEPAAVAENRRLLKAALNLPVEPTWLDQVHGINVVDATQARRIANTGQDECGVATADVPSVATVQGAAGTVPADARTTVVTAVADVQDAAKNTAPTADASVALSPGAVCVVMTADCLPVLFCDRQGTRVGAAHAGWRGLVGGVLEATMGALETPSSQLIAWLGPAIEQEAFEVGDEVRDAFLRRDASNVAAFETNARGRWQADLYHLARNELARLGVTAVYGGGFKCFADSERFFSYRRASRTGRMATLIWLDAWRPRPAPDT